MLRRVLCKFAFAAAFAGSAMAQMDNSAAEQLIFGNNQGAQPAEIKTFDKPAVSDLLTIDHSLSVFYDYVRQSGPLVRRLTANTPTTIFVPVDSAIMSLHRKPHEGPAPSSGNVQPLSEEEEDAKMRAYLEKWTSAYMVDGDDVELTPGTTVTTLAGDDARLAFAVREDAGGSASWEKVVVQPGEARIISMKEARDGRIYVLDRVLL